DPLAGLSRVPEESGGLQTADVGLEPGSEKGNTAGAGRDARCAADRLERRPASGAAAGDGTAFARPGLGGIFAALDPPRHGAGPEHGQRRLQARRQTAGTVDGPPGLAPRGRWPPLTW